MSVLFFIGLFTITFLGGLIPLQVKKIKPEWNNYLLAFSGAVLLGITFLHLLPEAFEELHFKAGYLILTGFFIQLFLQKFTHGLEHGHTHVHHFEESRHLQTLLLGIYVHAFMEGIPLGFTFRESGTAPSLFIAVASHKFPEALTLMSVIAVMPYSRKRKMLNLILFSLITPLAGLVARYFAAEYLFTAKLITTLIPIVIGAFIHISTTIFFESGTKHHQLDGKKLLYISLGLLLSLLTLLY